ncbi:MAG: GspE/PulE family protein [Candidatus Saccharibacteria bacterium]
MALSEEIYRKLFVEQFHLITPNLFDQIVLNANQLQIPLEQILIDQANISEEKYLSLLSQVFQVPVADLKLSSVDDELFQTIPRDFAESNLVFPFAIQDGKVCIAMSNPSDASLVEQLKSKVGGDLQIFVATNTQLKRALILYEGDLKQKIQLAAQDAIAASTQHDASAQNNLTSVDPVIQYVLAAAMLMEASDVHIQPYEQEVVIRFRVNGKLNTYITVPAGLASIISVNLKIKAKLKIDEKRVPQDGRFSCEVMTQKINIRLSTLPAIWGENIVMRLLSKDTKLSGISQIGLLPSDQKLLHQYLSMPHGMILITGPTNSGKTTTLYSFLQQVELDRLDQVNITTIEDPVEYSIPGIVQVQVDEEITFSTGLRAMLRQDLDVLMVGEIRDKDTAELTVRAALSGRLVFSTLHSNDSFATIPRLTDIGIPAYLVASTIDVIIAQRLAKKLCNYCKKPYTPDAELISKLSQEHDFMNSIEMLKKSGDLLPNNNQGIVFYHAAGCIECGQSGSIGRTGLFEVLPITTEIRNEAYAQVDSEKMKDNAVKAGFKTMFTDGIAKVLNGDISIEELFSVDY